MILACEPHQQSTTKSLLAGYFDTGCPIQWKMTFNLIIEIWTYLIYLFILMQGTQQFYSLQVYHKMLKISPYMYEPPGPVTQKNLH